MTVTAVIRFEDGSERQYDQNVDLKAHPHLKPFCQAALMNLFQRLGRYGREGGCPGVDRRRFNGNHVTGRGRHGGPKATAIISVDFGDGEDG